MNVTERTRPPLGHMLIARGLLTEEELLRALQLHEETGRPLGQVLVESGAVSAPALADILLLQHAWRPLGQLLVEKQLLTEGQLEDALREQAETGRPLGEIVRTRFFLASATIGNVLAEQYQLSLEMDRGFGSGLRRALVGGGSSDTANSADPADRSSLTSRLGRRPAGEQADGDRMTTLHAALESHEEAIAALGNANRKRSEEVAALREELAEREAIITDLRRRLANGAPGQI